ncbi:TRAP transporter small permease subunit [Pelagibaculum spongiae]|uniref:TRAP transporter small permease protein n=1 Tax=Pelagibaculum spongiae TaxID=2080658 RepID=A0A2V1GZC2_9GAMM|nr:TRAP transporter small permease subunit [Pelagibaculum spongiae]PVZ71513.1 C4-dicarboxylate ABC transporter [Pelagibaculum spongiae]
MSFMVSLQRVIDRFAEYLGKVSALLFLLMLINIFYDVVTRYLFNDVSIGFQELEWHLYSAVFLLGVPYALKSGDHVRVDLFYERFSDKKRAWVDLLGVMFFIMPFAYLVAYYGIDFARESYELGESSGDPGGLPHRWIIKSMIPFSFFCIAICGLGMLLKSINVLLGITDELIEYNHPNS